MLFGLYVRMLLNRLEVLATVNYMLFTGETLGQLALVLRTRP